jgi:BolA protein
MGMRDKIEDRLSQHFQPDFLVVENESHMHNVPPGTEIHFRVVMVSSQFEGRRSVARHQLIYQALQAEMTQGIHALALHTYTPEEWAAQGLAPESPPCHGRKQA